MATLAIEKHGEFNVNITDRPLAPNLGQLLGGLLWLPMWLMAAMAFPIAFILAIVRANLLATASTVQQAATAAALGQYVTAAMFLGFASAFAAIVFAIARILAVLRTGGGQVQHTSGRRVVTLVMPGTAWGMILLMAMGMMALLFTVVLHIFLGVSAQTAVLAGNEAGIQAVNTAAIWIEGVRRLGVAIYLASIALGLGTIVTALRFQAIRIRELPTAAPAARAA